MFILYFLSIVGYGTHLAKKIHLALIPGIVFSGIIVLEFVAGLLNILPLMTIGIFTIGLVLLTIEVASKIRRRVSIDLKDSLPLLVFWTIILIYSIIKFKGAIVLNYDDFSHWGTMAKCIITNDRLPIYSDRQIMFQSYPPATGLFIYYFSKTVGTGEGGYYFAQYILKIGYLSSLFVCIETGKEGKYGTRVIKYVVTSIVVVLISIYNVSSLSLSVDSVLSCSGIFCLLFIFYNRNSIEKNWQYLFIAPSACVLIKNSGVFFYVAAIALLILILVNRHELALLKSRRIIALLIPGVMVYLWQRHVQLVFADGLISKHAMTLAHASLVFLEKNSSEIAEEISIIGRSILNPLTNRTLLIWGGVILFSLFLERGNRSFNICALLFALSIVYEIGMLGMYIFSMPHREILYQQGADYLRYNGTLDAFLIGFAFCYIMGYIENLNIFKMKGLLAVSISTCMFLFSLFPRLQFEDLNPNVKVGPWYKDCMPLKVQLQKLLSEVDKQQLNNPYLVRTETKYDISGYAGYMVRYLTQSTNASVRYEDDDDVFIKYWEEEASQELCLDAKNGVILRK